MLQIEGEERAAPDVRGVEAFDDFFSAVGQISVAQEKADSAEL